MPCNVSVRGAFQLTPSVGRATGNHLICVMLTHISTHALHGESDHGIVAACITDDISIHALREESDRVWRLPRALRSNFNPRPPRGERLNLILLVTTPG